MHVHSAPSTVVMLRTERLVLRASPATSTTQLSSDRRIALFYYQRIFSLAIPGAVSAAQRATLRTLSVPIFGIGGSKLSTRLCITDLKFVLASPRVRDPSAPSSKLLRYYVKYTLHG